MDPKYNFKMIGRDGKNFVSVEDILIFIYDEIEKLHDGEVKTALTEIFKQLGVLNMTSEGHQPGQLKK